MYIKFELYIVLEVEVNPRTEDEVDCPSLEEETSEATGCFKKTARIENLNSFANISASTDSTKTVFYLKQSYGCVIAL